MAHGVRVKGVRKSWKKRGMKKPSHSKKSVKERKRSKMLERVSVG